MFEQAVPSKLLLVMERLAGIAEIGSTFYLAGGTALALYLGHRESRDIDLFSSKAFDVEKLSRRVLDLEGRILAQEEGTLHAVIDGIRVSFLYYPYNLLHPLTGFRGLQVASMEDIACMKAVAIGQRGDKKDFYDVVELLKVMEPLHYKNILLRKYGSRKINCYHILKSLFYFSEADDSPDPVTLNNTTWEMVKSYLLAKENELTEQLCLSPDPNGQN